MRKVGDFPFSFTLNWEVVALGFEELIDVLLLCSRQSRRLQSCLPLSGGGKRFVVVGGYCKVCKFFVGRFWELVTF